MNTDKDKMYKDLALSMLHSITSNNANSIFFIIGLHKGLMLKTISKGTFNIVIDNIIKYNLFNDRLSILFNTIYNGNMPNTINAIIGYPRSILNAAINSIKYPVNNTKEKVGIEIINEYINNRKH